MKQRGAVRRYCRRRPLSVCLSGWILLPFLPFCYQNDSKIPVGQAGIFVFYICFREVGKAFWIHPFTIQPCFLLILSKKANRFQPSDFSFGARNIFFLRMSCGFSLHVGPKPD
jgi:hypothetical protein